jgi:hypothetical protein
MGHQLPECLSHVSYRSLACLVEAHIDRCFSIHCGLALQQRHGTLVLGTYNNSQRLEVSL